MHLFLIPQDSPIRQVDYPHLQSGKQAQRGYMPNATERRSQDLNLS